jgi:hypothetical protein
MNIKNKKGQYNSVRFVMVEPRSSQDASSVMVGQRLVFDQKVGCQSAGRL